MTEQSNEARVCRVYYSLTRDRVLQEIPWGFARRTADTLVFMHQGRVWEKGPPRALFAAPKTPELEGFIRAVLEPND